VRRGARTAGRRTSPTRSSQLIVNGQAEGRRAQGDDDCRPLVACRTPVACAHRARRDSSGRRRVVRVVASRPHAQPAATKGARDTRAQDDGRSSSYGRRSSSYGNKISSGASDRSSVIRSEWRRRMRRPPRAMWRVEAWRGVRKEPGLHGQKLLPLMLFRFGFFDCCRRQRKSQRVGQASNTVSPCSRPIVQRSRGSGMPRLGRRRGVRCERGLHAQRVCVLVRGLR
jgi:hypothetical protein